MKNDNANKFWSRFDKIRLNKDLSISQVCNLNKGLVYRTITQQRTRNILPNVETLVMLSESLEISLDYLITGEEYKNPFYQELENNLEAKELCCKLLKCNKHQLDLINSMINSWALVEEEQPNASLA